MVCAGRREEGRASGSLEVGELVGPLGGWVG